MVTLRLKIMQTRRQAIRAHSRTQLLLVLNTDSNLNFLHLLMPLKTVQGHHSHLINILCD